MKKMYLVQTGFIQNDVVANVNDETTLTGRNNGFARLDYMGSAEFEFGAIPSAYRIVMHDFKKYSLFLDVMRTTRDVPVNVFCRTDDKDEVINMLNDYLEDSDPSTIRKYRLKEPIKFEYHMIKWYDSVTIGRGKIPNFWWDIRNHFMFFTGATDRQKAFHKAISNDYYNWWMTFNEDEREEKYKEALKRMY